MLDALIMAVGAIAGVNAHYYISRYAAQILGSAFPYGTLIIHLTGSLLAGFFVIWTAERVLVDPRWRLLVVVGFCGAFHHVFQLRLRDHGLSRARTMDADVY